jgi:hypothetical protein
LEELEVHSTDPNISKTYKDVNREYKGFASRHEEESFYERELPELSSHMRSDAGYFAPKESKLAGRVEATDKSKGELSSTRTRRNKSVEVDDGFQEFRVADLADVEHLMALQVCLCL